jgi:hypothetical protein
MGWAGYGQRRGAGVVFPLFLHFSFFSFLFYFLIFFEFTLMHDSNGMNTHQLHSSSTKYISSSMM